MNSEKFSFKLLFNTSVIIAALGYFVDVYDLVLFNMVRISSLQSFNLSETEITNVGLNLHNWQMSGMLIGGVVWGILGDKKGRLSVLFASILTYSIANIANGFVQSVEAYSFWRFVAGFGLAGELGVGITLVAEVMSKENRGYGTMVVASVGVTGAIFAAIASLTLDWRITYFIGGALGLALLLLRISVFESGMFDTLKKKKEVARGDFFSLFKNYKTFSKYVKCIVFGIPIWFVIGLLIMYATDFFSLYHKLENKATVQPIIIMIGYMGLVVGDIASGSLSQYLRSRKKVIFIFMSFMALLMITYFIAMPYMSLAVFYVLVFFIGVSCGYWAIFVTVAAEQFGTNLRATVATTVPNFVRGAVVPITLFYKYLVGSGESKILSASLIGAFCIVIAMTALYFLDETFGKDMDYLEE
jgi:putative MFS transporter